MTYTDPRDQGWKHPNLVGGLMAKPSTEKRTQLEDQTTVALAWLLDRWPRFARAFVQLCFAGDEVALAESERAAVMGARTWRRIKKLACSPGTGTMAPDISIAGDRGTFELIVENKVDAAPHYYDCTQGCHTPAKIVQHDAYALSWAMKEDGDPDEARVRRVSVLSRDPVDPGTAPKLRGVDITWKTVRDLIDDLSNDPDADGGVVAVARDFVAALDEHVFPVRGPAIADPFLARGFLVLEHLLPLLAASVDGRSTKPLFNAKSGYVGGYVRFTADDESERSLWVYVTGPAGRYAVATFAQGLWVAADGKWSPAGLDALAAAGFEKLRDLAQYSFVRRWFELDGDLAPEAAAATLAETLAPVAADVAGAGGERVDLSRRDLADRIRGCLLGGALGDALGAPVEFMTLAQIRKKFGRDGITELAPAYGRVGAITDDTQMTLFTAEGLMRAHNRLIVKGISHAPSVIYGAYLRWLHTQGGTSESSMMVSGPDHEWPDGWLVGIAGLHSRRAPGNTCLSALEGPQMGTVEQPLNDSKGCGAVMRMAPIGLIDIDHFQVGAEAGAVTHGHPSGYLSAGFLAHVIARVARGTRLSLAIDEALELLSGWEGADETRRAVERAVALADEGSPTPEKVESLGGAWVGEEALAISLYCALVAESFEYGVRLAVNHGGDSDSTGAITGNLLGAMHGTAALPERWLDQLELRDVIERLAADLALHNEPIRHDEHGYAAAIEWERYPGR